MTLLVAGSVGLVAGGWLAVHQIEKRPRQISLEQQNRIMRTQIEAYKAALIWKMGELQQWEAAGQRKALLTAEEAARLKNAGDVLASGKRQFDDANKRISELERAIRAEDHCDKCKLVPGAFQWASMP